MKDLIATSYPQVNRVSEFLGDIQPEVLQDMLYIKRIRGEGEVIEDAWSSRRKGDNTVFSSIATGMTKIVLFPKDCEDVVFKIPYFGEELYVYSDDDDGLELYDTREFSEAADGDYCKREEKLFRLAVQSRVDRFFAQTEYVTTLLGYIPLYASERCEAFEERDEERRYSLLGCTGVPKDIEDMLIERYSPDELARLAGFLQENHISDLHSGNWGMSSNGDVKILDYSGFFEEDSLEVEINGLR